MYICCFYINVKIECEIMAKVYLKTFMLGGINRD